MFSTHCENPEAIIHHDVMMSTFFMLQRLRAAQATPFCSCICKAGDIKLRGISGEGGRLNLMVIMTICSVDEDGLAALESIEDSRAAK